MTNIVMAAIDDTAVAPRVLSVADAVAATLFGGEVEALHVHEDGNDTAIRAAEAAGVRLRIEQGPTVASIVRAAASSDVATVVVGSRSDPEGPRPAGHTALEVMTSVAKPLFAVPPNTNVPWDLKKVLVPLDATSESAAAATQTLLLASGCGLDTIVLHVQDFESLPMFDDHPHHEIRAWIDEFVARNCPPSVDVTVELRIGRAHERVLDVVNEAGPDLVVLGWSQDLSPGRALIVRETLRRSEVPVLLLPRVPPSVDDAAARSVIRLSSEPIRA
jgi:hypothetical protein